MRKLYIKPPLIFTKDAATSALSKNNVWAIMFCTFEKFNSKKVVLKFIFTYTKVEIETVK